jgi:hypothetical protein
MSDTSVVALRIGYFAASAPRGGNVGRATSELR